MKRILLCGVVMLLSVCMMAADQTYEFTCKLDKPGLTSAGIYDAQGHLVRVLWTMKEEQAGPLNAKWDGKDDDGATAPAGAYTWKVVLNRSTYTSFGTVGN